ncbi:MAG: hypothetical protein V1799_04715 [bacterium]
MESYSTPWWLDQLNRRKATQRILKIGTVGTLIAIGGTKLAYDALEDEDELATDSLKLQQAQGWNVGSTARTLLFSDQTNNDSMGSADWKSYLDFNQLIRAYEPRQTAWKPFFVPTLIQSLFQPSLRQALLPINSYGMKLAYARGLGMREIINSNPLFTNTMLMVDLPGPESIAFTAAIADLIDPILTFDNWPHPLGVVPSHQLLSAMLYYAREVMQKSLSRPAIAPAMLVLDRNRLASYSDADNQFDNRYVAKVPTAESLTKNGIKKLLYVLPENAAGKELDDLNEDFVSYKEKNLAVDILPMNHFTQDPGAPPDSSNTYLLRPPIQPHHVYYYGGRSYGHWWFYSNYPHYRIGDQYRTINEPFPFSRPFFQPNRRSTLFTRSFTRGSEIAKTRPSNFGQVTTRVSRSSRSITGIRSGRSGSYGRSRSFFSS